MREATTEEIFSPEPRKPRWKIARTSCRCGGNWAWLKERPSGAWEMQGCVCHHPYTLAMRAT